MRKGRNLWWNTAHSSPKVIDINQEYYKTKSISELIEIRDGYYDFAKAEEEKDMFYNWNPNYEPEFAYCLFEYEDALEKIRFFCELIANKRKSMYSYCDWSFERDSYHELAEEIVDYIKKKPDLTYDAVIEEFGEAAIVSLDYLIESKRLVRKGKVGSNHWKVMN